MAKASSTANGKGNEWALASALAELLVVPLRSDNSAKKAEESFNSIDHDLRGRFETAARLSALHLIERENMLLTRRPPRQVSLQADRAGEHGDVRDVVVSAGIDLFGISCKSNHAAYKHPRISKHLDWAKVWGLSELGCSTEYFRAVAPVFDELARIKEESSGTKLFSEIPNLHEEYYVPCLDAFQTELLRLFDTQENLPEKLTRYLVGFQDFYKVITRKSHVEIQEFNFAGSLSGKKSIFPSKLIAIDTEEGGQWSFNVRFDRGYVFNFRLHSASSRVEPSFKFDIQAISLPASEIYTHQISF